MGRAVSGTAATPSHPRPIRRHGGRRLIGRLSPCSSRRPCGGGVLQGCRRGVSRRDTEWHRGRIRATLAWARPLIPVSCASVLGFVVPAAHSRTQHSSPSADVSTEDLARATRKPSRVLLPPSTSRQTRVRSLRPQGGHGAHPSRLRLPRFPSTPRGPSPGPAMPSFNASVTRIGRSRRRAHVPRGGTPLVVRALLASSTLTPASAAQLTRRAADSWRFAPLAADAHG